MDAIDTLLTRGVEAVYPSHQELETVLRSGRKLRVYQGFDPTGKQLHIGHLLGLRKLRQWHELGHKVIFLIGDFTATIGDPSGKSQSRKQLLKEDVIKNAKDYKIQAARILNFKGPNPVEIKYNSQWLEKLTTHNLLQLIHNFSAQQIIKRDLFQKRLKSGQDLFLNEFFYPVLQAYDCVFMDIDVEVGGNDQLFNMLAGRDLMHKIKKKNKFVITTPLLTDSKGQKIGKTEGNVIALTTPPNDLFGMIMSLSDDVIVKGLEYLTDYPMDKITDIAEKIKSGTNPMPFKKLLSSLVVSQLNSKSVGEAAQTYFENLHQKKSPDVSVPILKIENGTLLTDAITAFMQISRSEVKRLFSQQGIDINGKTITTVNTNVKKGDIIKVGKHHTFKIA